MKVKRMIAEAFPPGEFIREELAARGWSQTDLATIGKLLVRWDITADLLGFPVTTLERCDSELPSSR